MGKTSNILNEAFNSIKLGDLAFHINITNVILQEDLTQIDWKSQLRPPNIKEHPCLQYNICNLQIKSNYIWSYNVNKSTQELWNRYQ